MRLLIYLLKTGLCYSDSFAFCFISLSFSLPEFEDLHFTYFFLWPDVGNVFFFSTHFSFLFTQSSSLSSMVSQLVFFFYSTNLYRSKCPAHDLQVMLM